MLTGTYKLDIGGISIYDWRDGHISVDADGEPLPGAEVSPYDRRKSSKKLTSIGSLRISTLETTLMHGQIPTEGFGAPYREGEFAPEVYIDGNEVPGRARLRIGTVILHDQRWVCAYCKVAARGFRWSQRRQAAVS